MKSAPGGGCLCVAVSVITALGFVLGNRVQDLSAENQPGRQHNREVSSFLIPQSAESAGLKATPSPFRPLCFDGYHLTMVLTLCPLGSTRKAYECPAEGVCCHLMNYE